MKILLQKHWGQGSLEHSQSTRSVFPRSLCAHGIRRHSLRDSCLAAEIRECVVCARAAWPPKSQGACIRTRAARSSARIAPVAARCWSAIDKTHREGAPKIDFLRKGRLENRISPKFPRARPRSTPQNPCAWWTGLQH